MGLLQFTESFLSEDAHILSSKFNTAPLPRWHSGKESTYQLRECSILRSRTSPGGKNGKPLEYSYLENSIDRGAWRAIIHGVAQR